MGGRGQEEEGLPGPCPVGESTSRGTSGFSPSRSRVRETLTCLARGGQGDHHETGRVPFTATPAAGGRLPGRPLPGQGDHAAPAPPASCITYAGAKAGKSW